MATRVGGSEIRRQRRFRTKDCMSDNPAKGGPHPAYEDGSRCQLKITEVTCKNALVKSGIEGVDYALNPYIGCEHACVYCYAEFMKKYTNHKEDWGEFVDVKINVAERLRHQIKKTKPGRVQMGTVTDAYQPVEERFCLARECLEVLADSDLPVSVQTKSDLILRDIDILKKIKDIEVGFTITCPDPEIERLFEPGAPDLERRFEALRELVNSDIPTYVFFGPILPFFSDHPDSLSLLFNRLRKTGVKKIYLDKMNYLKGKRRKINRVLGDGFPQALRFYDGVMECEDEYAKWLKVTLTSTLSRFAFEPEILF